MKQHFKFILLGLLILASASDAQNNSTFTEQKVKAINAEISDAIYQKDLSVLDKYLYEGTEIFIDLDPNPNSGEKQLTVKEYRELMEMGLMMIDDMEIKEDIVEIKINKKMDQARLKIKAHVSADFMGIKSTEESTSTTTFGLINGEIKILKIKQQQAKPTNQRKDIGRGLSSLPSVQR